MSGRAAAPKERTERQSPSRVVAHERATARLPGAQHAATASTPTTGAAAAAIAPGLAHGREVVRRTLEVGAAHDAAEATADRAAAAATAVLHPGAADARWRGYGALRAPAEVGPDGGRLRVETDRELSAARGAGRGLPGEVRRTMQGVLGASLGDVRMHADRRAQRLSEAMAADAFTVGKDIFFRGTPPSVATPGGAHLWAHELHHAIAGGATAGRHVMRSGISAPFNVTVRTGNKVRQPIQGPRSAQLAFSSRDGTGPKMGATSPKEGAKTGLEREERDRARQESGVQSPGIGVSSEHEHDPAVAKIPIPGVTPELEEKDPYAAVGVYVKYTGGLLQKTQKHETEIEVFARRIENEHVRAIAAKSEWDQLSQAIASAGDGKAKKAEKRKRALEDRLGAKLLEKAGVPRSSVWTVVMRIAEERTRVANLARQDADEDVPMVDGVYELARDAKKRVQALTGGRSREHTTKRYGTKLDKDDFQGAIKHQKRYLNFPAATDTARKVGLAAREAKLSADRLAVKKEELKVHNTSIDDAVPTAVKAGTLFKWVARTGANAALGFVTATVVQVEQEQVRTEKMSATSQKSWKITTISTRLDREISKASELFKKKPYGRVTSFHVGLQLFNVVLREVRNILAGIATLVGIAAAAAFAAPAVASVLTTISVVLGLIALAITAVKLVIEGILASWSVIRRALSSNARHYNLLNEQIKAQGGESLVDATKVGMSFASPALGNVVGLSGGATYLNPIQQLQHAQQGLGFMTHTAVTRSILMTLGQTAANTGTTTASGLVAGTVNTKLTSGSDARHGLAEGARPQLKTRTHEYDAGLPRGEEPAWIRKARESEKATRSSAIDSLVTAHQAKIGRFSERTQALMQKALEAKSAAAKGSSATKQQDPEDSAGKAKGVTGKLADLAQAAFDGSADLKGNFKSYVLAPSSGEPVAYEVAEARELAGVNLSGSGDDGEQP